MNRQEAINKLLIQAKCFDDLSHVYSELADKFYKLVNELED